MANKMTIKEAQTIADWYDDHMNALCDDPMTEAMGAPVGDFAEEWSRKHRRMIGKGLEHATGKAREILLAAAERYMP